LEDSLKKLLKLTGGSYAGRRLYVPKTGVRPATNRIREAIFSTLLSYFKEGVRGCAVLDLFAGTGSLGLEALSRGAERATFVDLRQESVKAIKKNLEILGFTAELVHGDAGRFIKKHQQIDYDLIFMDPPYKYPVCDRIVHLLKTRLVKPSMAVLVYERSYERGLPDFGEEVQLLKRKKYGQSELLYYRI
jgi:16S rRNA (guanine966-N2)-methyltransferase